MGDKAVTSFLGCCVQLLQILMEVTALLVKNKSPFSFIHSYVSDACRTEHGADERMIKSWNCVLMSA